MKDQKMIMLTNKSARKFTTSQGDFHPGTSKEFAEEEAIKLLGYSKEILRIEDAMKNPDVKDRVGKLERKIDDLGALVKAKDEVIKKLREDAGKSIDSKEIEKLDKKIKGLEGYIKELEKTNKEYSEGVDEQNKKLKKKDARITELENMLKEANKKGKKGSK